MWLSDLKFVITGTFQEVSREKLKLIIEDNGGVIFIFIIK